MTETDQMSETLIFNLHYADRFKGVLLNVVIIYWVFLGYSDLQYPLRF